MHWDKYTQQAIYEATVNAGQMTGTSWTNAVRKVARSMCSAVVYCRMYHCGDLVLIRRYK